MDKHTKRYFTEFFEHYSESMNFSEAMDYMKQGADSGYLASAIQDEFTGMQRDILQIRLFDRMLDREG